MIEAKMVLKQLDDNLSPLCEQGAMIVPKQGWVRTVRKAIGMTIKQLAARLAVDPSRVVKIEMSEAESAVTLKTLKGVAEQLDCRLVYALVPKTSFEEMVDSQAKKVALQQIKRTAHTMDLEDQSVDPQWQKEQLEDLSQELLRKSWKHLWEE